MSCIRPPRRVKRAASPTTTSTDSNSLIVAGVGNNPSNMGRRNYKTNFAPRFGLSYRFDEKTVIHTERFKVKFRAESYNFTNTGFGKLTFGQITSAGIGNSADGGSRNIQFGLRLLF
jgi:hypothetical protein